MLASVLFVFLIFVLFVVNFTTKGTKTFTKGHGVFISQNIIRYYPFSFYF